MAQATSVSGDPAQRAPASPDRGASGARPRALPRVQALIDAGRDRNAAQNLSWWDAILEALRSLLRPPILRHAVAALQRGNLDAAFALLREEVKVRPGQAESALLFWNAAVSCERAAEAADAMARLVRSEAAAEESLEQAANHWTALVDAVPDAQVDVSALAKIVPLLRARYEQARGEAAKLQSHALLADGLRRCVDPAHGPLNPALALRLVEEARGIDAEVARQAARVALQSNSLHEAKRTRLEELIASLEQGEWPDAQPAARAAAPAARQGAEPVVRTAAPPAARTPAPRAARPPAAQKPAPRAKAKPETGKQAPAVAAPRARRRAPAPEPEPETQATPAPSGRRTVALTQDEIEAASSRLAERMAARPAAQPDPAPAAPRIARVPEPVLDAEEALEVDDPLEKDEPIAILEQDEGVAILEVDDANAILEVDAGDDALEAGAVGAMLDEEPDAALEGEEPEAVLEDSNPDFEFGGAAAAPAMLAGGEAEDAILDEGDAPSEGGDFAFGGSLEDEPDADFEFGAPAEEGEQGSEDFEIGEPEVDSGEDASELSEAADEDAAEAELVPESPPPLRAIDILPVELGPDGLVAYEVAQAQRTRIDYRAIEAIAAAEVTGLADDPILVVELILRARPGRPRSALRMRCDTFDPTSLFPDHTDASQALREMLSDLLERTRAVPLPDPDSALALQPQRYESLPDFEAAVLARLAP